MGTAADLKVMKVLYSHWFEEGEKPKADLAVKTLVDQAPKRGLFSLAQIATESNLDLGVVTRSVWDLGLRITTSPQSTMQRRFQQIRQAIADGASHPKEIAQIVGLAEGSIRTYGWMAGINLPGVGPRGHYKEKKNKDRILRKNPLARSKEIQNAITQGMYADKEIGKMLGLVAKTVRSYRSLAGLPSESSLGVRARRPERKRKTSRGLWDVAHRTQRLFDKGERSIEKICQISNVSPQTLYRVCKTFEVEYPTDLVPWKFKPEIDQGLKEGLPIPKAAEKLGITRMSIYNYLRESGQFTIYQEGSKERKKEEKKAAREFLESRVNFLNMLRHATFERSQKEGWAIGKAMEFRLGKKIRHHTYSNEQLVLLFSAYKAAQDAGEKVSVYEFAKISNIFFSNIGRILRKVGLEPMHGTWERQVTPKEKKEAIDRSYGRGFPSSVIAHFLGVEDYVVVQRWVEIGPSQKLAARLGTFERKWLNHAIASQFYEAQDLGFRESEIAFLYDKPEGMVGYSLDNRGKIGGEIKDLLRFLYPGKKFPKPYIQDQLKTENTKT